MCQVQRSQDARSDLTVQQLMAEPIVRDLMQADHVDPAAFEALLSSVAAWPPAHAAQSARRRRQAEWFGSVKSWAHKVKLLPYRR
jgi:hypothetical protein